MDRDRELCTKATGYPKIRGDSEMKRDMDLCRKILLSVEAREGTVGPEEVSIEGYTEGQIGYHAKLLADQGLLEGRDITGVGGSTHRYAPRCLTYAGHDFLEAARDDTRWKKAKAEVAAKGLPVTLEVMKRVLLKLVEKILTEL